MPRSDLFHAHLSGAATPDETDALDAALTSDPALAREFAQAARVEAQLSAHFARNRPVLPLLAELQNGSPFSPAPSAATKATADLPSPPANAQHPLRRRLPAAAAILVALGLLAASVGWLVRNHELASSGDPSATGPDRKPLPRTVETPTFPKPPTFGTHQESPEMRALRQRLERYHLTAIGLDQAMPLSKALQRLLSRARELNHLHRPVIDSLSVAAPEGRAAVAASEAFVRLSHKNLTLMDALRLVAVQAGCDIRFDPPGVISLQPLPELDSRKLVTRTLRVRPDFVSSRIAATEATTTTHPPSQDPAAQMALQTRKDISDFQSQLASIKDKRDEELIGAVANLGMPDPRSAALYSSYLADRIKLMQMEQLGAGPGHPDILALKAGIENQKAQLEEGAEHLRSILQDKLSTASAVLANVKKIEQEISERQHSPFVAAEEKQPPLTTAAANVVAREALEEFGVRFPQNTDAVFNPATSTLTVTHTEAALRQIEAFLAVESGQLATMINVTTKWLEFADGHELENRLMDLAEFSRWLQESNSLKGATLLSAPQVTTRSGQAAGVEVTRDSGDQPPVDGPWPDWQGIQLHIHATLEGEAVHLTGSAEVRRSRDLPLDQLPGKRTTPTADLVSTAVDIEAIVPPGQTALFSLSENADGPHLVGALTINLIDPSGQPVGGESGGKPK